MIVTLWKILRSNPLEAATGCALVALLALSGWLYVDATRWEARATVAEQLVETMRREAQQQDRRHRAAEKESERERVETIEARDRALAVVSADLGRLRRQSAADRARRPVPTVPAVDATLDACRARVAAAGRSIDDLAARLASVDDRVADLVERAGGADRNRVALIECRADTARAAALSK